MAFIKKKSIPNSVKRDMWNKAGFREKQDMTDSRWVSRTKDGDLITFVRKNPNYGRGLDYTKTYHSTYSVKRHRWV